MLKIYSASSLLYATVLFVVLMTDAIYGFAFSTLPRVNQNPVLTEFLNAQEGMLLHVDLDIGTDEKNQQRPHLFLTELEFLLLKEEDSSSSALQQDDRSNQPKLPGINGPCRNLSSGTRHLKVLKEPSFVNLQGTQKVMFENGCWEIIWSEKAPAGAIVCGFDIPNEAIRNGAKLPAGNLYITFVVWKRKDLFIEQERRYNIEKIAKQYMKEKNELFEKYREEKNIVKKALLYRKVALAVEKYNRSGITKLKNIPSIADGISLQNDIILITKGTVWTKGENEINGKSSNLISQQQILGAAIIREYKELNENVEPVLEKENIWLSTSIPIGV